MRGRRAHFPRRVIAVASDNGDLPAASNCVISKPFKLSLDPQAIVCLIDFVMVVVTVVFRVGCWKARVNVLRYWDVLFSLSLFTARDICCLERPVLVKSPTHEISAVRKLRFFRSLLALRFPRLWGVLEHKRLRILARHAATETGF